MRTFEQTVDARPRFLPVGILNLNHLSIALLAASWLLGTTRALAEYEVHLRGLFNLAEWQGALLEVNHSLARSNTPPMIFTMTRLVKPGEKFEDATIKGAHVNFEILEINTDGERVKLRENGKVSVYGFEKVDAAALSTRLGIELQDARFEDAVDLYSNLKSRTVLVHPKSTWFPVSLRAAVRNETEAVAALETAFLDKGISTVADGEKFVLMVTTVIEKRITPGSKKVDSASPQFGSSYMDSPVSTVIENYGRILERAQAGAESIPRERVYLRSRILSKAEMLYAYDTLLEWNGLKVVIADEKTFKVVRLAGENSP